MEMDILVNLLSDELIMLDKACITCPWGQVSFGPKNWFISTGFRKNNQVVKEISFQK